MTPISERKRASFYIFKNQKNAKRLYIYTKSKTIFKKQDYLSYVFIHKMPDTLHYMIFHEIFEIGIYIYTESMKFCVMQPFYVYKNPNTSKKARQFASHFFILKKMTLCVTRFSWGF